MATTPGEIPERPEVLPWVWKRCLMPVFSKLKHSSFAVPFSKILTLIKEKTHFHEVCCLWHYLEPGHESSAFWAAIDRAGILPQQVPHAHHGQKPPFADTGTLCGIFVLMSQAVSQPPATWALSTVVLFLVIKWVFFLLEWAWRYPENEARCTLAKFQKASRQMKPLRLSCEFPQKENATADVNSGAQTILPEGDKQPPSPCRPLPLLRDWSRSKRSRASAAPAAREGQTHSSKGALELLMLISIEPCAAFRCGAGGREALSLSRTLDQEQA